MLFADWVLPFVYNVSLLHFEASVLVRLLLGGLVASERMTGEKRQASTDGKKAGDP